MSLLDNTGTQWDTLTAMSSGTKGVLENPGPEGGVVMTKSEGARHSAPYRGAV